MARESREFGSRRGSLTDAVRNVERVARTGRGGGGGRERFRAILRPGFGALVVLIIAAGTALVAFAYTTRDVQARPVQNEDHWHSPYGLWDCTLALPPDEDGEGGTDGDWIPHFPSDADGLGIHSHNDGIIHIHPFFEAASGANATIGVFLEAMGAELTDDYFEVNQGRVLEEGVDCGGEPAIIQVHRWEFVGSVDEAPDVFTENLADVRFRNNGEVWVIARAPEGADLLPPPSIAILGQIDPFALRPPEAETTPGDGAGEGEAPPASDPVEVEVVPEPGSGEIQIPLEPGSGEIEIPLDSGSTEVEIPLEPGSGEIEIPLDSGSTEVEIPLEPGSGEGEAPPAGDDSGQE